jgi:Fic family protein
MTAISPNFHVDGLNRDILPLLESSEVGDWEEYFLDFPFLLSEKLDSFFRYMYARGRFQRFSPIMERLKEPFLYLLVAEAYFFLSDFNQCYSLLIRLCELFPKSDVASLDQLNRILQQLDSVRKQEEEKDEVLFRSAGLEEGSFELFPAVSPVPCPLDITLPQGEMDEVTGKWKSLQETETVPDAILNQFRRLACLESNLLEGVFELDEISQKRVVQRGFSVDFIDENQRRTNGNIVEALESTLKSHNFALQCLNDLKNSFTIDFILQLHRILIGKDYWFQEHNDGQTLVITMAKAGQLRTVSCMTTHWNRKKKINEVIQFCHHSRLREEMIRYCELARELLLDETVDPFLKSAWLQWAFLAIYPFEDGNGRVARIISSLPLSQVSLPLVIVRQSNKEKYFRALQSADREANLLPLSEFLKNSLSEGIAEIESLQNEILPPTRRMRRRLTPGMRRTGGETN